MEDRVWRSPPISMYVALRAFRSDRTLNIHQTYKAMEKIFHSGKAKAIGVSNFAKYEMEDLLKNCSVTPAVHQIECHPWLQQSDFVDWHRDKGIHITHYSSLGNQNQLYSSGGEKLGKMIDEPILGEIAQKHGKTSAQVAIGRFLEMVPRNRQTC